MGKRKVSILEPAADTMTDITLFIEDKGMPESGKKFIDETFLPLPEWDGSTSGITAKANKKICRL
ncbi:hypothetical protein [Ferruginibacter sp.]|uniref:hypothetical protein n=1 Tax=Ferruginibacter sp. TaxID=1940288 RepID=UPI0019CAB506|nr:hypothetical protein [Ferruginibacter sp.]MBC7629320.1 hypothetical protein [Ferruginibacter sp.]